MTFEIPDMATSSPKLRPLGTSSYDIRQETLFKTKIMYQACRLTRLRFEPKNTYISTMILYRVVCFTGEWKSLIVAGLLCRILYPMRYNNYLESLFVVANSYQTLRTELDEK